MSTLREPYKGHWIITNGINGYIWIEVGGAKIASCATVKDAKVQIDILTDRREAGCEETK